jgi:hypothetical protein
MDQTSKILRIAALFGLALGSYVAVPNNASAHCLPGNIHMNGVRYYEYQDSGQLENAYDGGCTGIGTVQEGCNCVSWGWNNGYVCLQEQCAYNCDGC